MFRERWQWAGRPNVSKERGYRDESTCTNWPTVRSKFLRLAMQTFRYELSANELGTFVPEIAFQFYSIAPKRSNHNNKLNDTLKCSILKILLQRTTDKSVIMRDEMRSNFKTRILFVYLLTISFTNIFKIDTPTLYTVHCIIARLLVRYFCMSI